MVDGTDPVSPVAATHPTELSLAEVRALAHLLHRTQVDKIGRPYAEHVEAVERGVQLRGGSIHQRMAALLHDTVEDDRITLSCLFVIGVPTPALVLVEAMTHRADESRSDYIARVMATPGATVIKQADLAHNEGRLAAITNEPLRERLRAKYARDRAQMTGLAGG